MTHEKRTLFVGLLIGAVLGALVAFLLLKSNPGSDKGESQTQPAPPVSGSAGAPGHQMPVTPQAPEQGGAVQLTEEEQRAAGVETTTVKRQILNRELTAVGRVEEPETQLGTISARIGGRIDKLFVDYTGQTVRRGAPIALIYSPEVLSTASEYKLAVENRRKLGPTAAPEVLHQADELLNATRQRLELWGVPAKQIEDIGLSQQPNIHITIQSPLSGIVTERKVTEGQYVREGDVLYTVTDLSTVWVKADVYESDLETVRVGTTAEVLSDALPGQRVKGRVGFIEPVANPETRTVPVRVQVNNPRFLLRPGMFVNVSIRGRAGRESLAVPRSAVLNTGTKRLVYIAKGNGVFEAREVDIGEAAGDLYPVLKGLNAGETVVTQGNFLIDSQTRISGGMTGLFGGSKEFARQNQTAGAGAQTARIEFQVDPNPPKGGSNNKLLVRVLDQSGKPVSDAAVKVTFLMPAMPEMSMPEMRASADLRWSGSAYAGEIKVPESGSWNVSVEASRGGQVIATYRTRVTAR